MTYKRAGFSKDLVSEEQQLPFLGPFSDPLRVTHFEWGKFGNTKRKAKPLRGWGPPRMLAEKRILFGVESPNETGDGWTSFF